jgi:GMP synthase-like glutamine amidotransferase
MMNLAGHTVDELKKRGIAGVILSGGPASVYEKRRA